MSEILFSDDSIAIRNYLLTDKTQIDIRDSNGNTPLINAVKNKSTDVLDVLISFGANLDLKNNQGNTALHIATENKDYTIISILLQEGADGLIRNNKLEIPLHICARVATNTDLINLLLPASDFNAIDIYDRTPLLIALNDNRMKQKIIRYIAEYTDNINQIGKVPIYNQKYTNALYESINMGYYDIIEILLKKGADVNYIDEDGKSMLIHAVSRRHDWISTKFLVDAGAEINRLYYSGDSILTIAISNFAHPNTIMYLIENGADVNVTTKNGNSVLGLIISKYNTTKYINLMYDMEREEIIRNYRYSITKEINSKQKIFIEMLLERGLDVNKINANGESILGLALINNAPIEILNLLIEKGADVNYVDNKGESILKLATKEDHLSCETAEFYFSTSEKIEFLLKTGININNQDKLLLAKMDSRN